MDLDVLDGVGKLREISKTSMLDERSNPDSKGVEISVQSHGLSSVCQQ